MKHQPWFAKVLLVSMPLTLAIEIIYGIMGTERFIPVYAFVWVVLRHIVLLDTVGVCIFVLVRWSQRTAVSIHRYSALFSLISFVSFFIPYFWAVLPEIFWALLCYCSAAVSCVVLLSIEHLLSRKRALSRVPQRRNSVLAERAESSSVQGNALDQKRSAEGKASMFFQAVSSDPPIVVLLHASKDRPWAEKCSKHLRVLKMQGQVALWDENMLLPGAVRQDGLSQVLAHARIAILMVSADFLVECVAQLECVLRCERNRADFWVCPVIVSACAYEQSSLWAFRPYWSAENPAQEPLHNLPLFRQNESFCGLVKLIAEKLNLTKAALEEPSSEECLPVRASTEPSSSECVIPNRGITEDDQVMFAQVEALLEKEGLFSHTYHSQHTNEEYLRHLRKIITSLHPTEKEVKWARITMNMIMGGTPTAA